MTPKQEINRDLTSFLLYLFGFLLLWEWLRPVELLTNTGSIEIFLVFLIISFLLSFLGIRAVYGSLIIILYILFEINHLYFKDSFFGFSWVSSFLADIKENVIHIYQKEWLDLSDIFKSLLFFILLWLMTYLIQYWLITQKQIFIFFFMTMVYITVLDTFTQYDADVAIVRTVITGFAAMGLLTFRRIISKEKIKNDISISRKWLLPLSVMIIFSVSVGLAAPKANPIWPDPVPFIKSMSADSGDGDAGISTVGYGIDDSKLGGPFQGNNNVVFRTEIINRHYWKVEAKDFYTGKGWIATDEGSALESFTPSDPVPIFPFADGVKKETKTDKVYAYRNYPHIIYPIGITHVKVNSNSTFEIDHSNEKIYSKENAKSGYSPLPQYTITHDLPSYSVTKMTSAMSGEQSGLPKEFIQKYTQLPDELPKRVKDLALEITKGEENWFEKARKIEKYFVRTEYQYDQKNVAIPGENDDYVDQFLFESKRGYCDNFSTSMVVMLRSIGIPARWVKGYTEGDFQGDAESGDGRIFIITNNNAHSWVEVYYPEVGWVPFEPTKGFDNNVTFSFDAKNNSAASQQTKTETKAPELEQQEQEKDTQVEKKAKARISFSDFWDDTKVFLNNVLPIFLFGLAVIALVTFIVYKLRFKWLPHYFVFTYKRRLKDEDFVKAYLVLLKQLQRYGLSRSQDQTLRDYAKYVDGFFSSKDMTKLTASYEQYLYKGNLKEGVWKEEKELWENLIKRTIA